MASGPPLEAKGTDLSRAGRGTSHPGEIIPDWWATSSRNSGRNYLGMAGGIIPESWAASTGISIALLGIGQRLKDALGWRFDGYFLNDGFVCTNCRHRSSST